MCVKEMFALSFAAKSFDVSSSMREGRLATGSNGSPSSVRAAAASALEMS